MAETPVTWSVSGGAAPYTLQIDGEGRDAAGAYAGATGTASVSCALRSSGVFFPHPLDEEHRRYRTEPEVDSGLKAIRAVVTDGSGATAEASVEVYVILELGGSGSILERGKTYRVFGLLLTAPESYDVEVGSTSEPQCDDPPPGTRCAAAFRLWLVGTGAHLAVVRERRWWGRASDTRAAQRAGRLGARRSMLRSIRCSIPSIVSRTSQGVGSEIRALAGLTGLAIAGAALGGAERASGNRNSRLRRAPDDMLTACTKRLPARIG